MVYLSSLDRAVAKPDRAVATMSAAAIMPG
jgi:hypothetical protein